MHNFFTKLFSENNPTKLEIKLFNFWHFFYLIIIFGTAILLTFLLKNKSQQAKEKACKVFSYLTIGLYVADFFIMPLSDSYDGISSYKLPFNICTIMAILAPFAQFNKKFTPIKDTIIVLSVASGLMWMTYPGSALGGEPPFCYIIFQTFMYHGVLFIWGFLNLSLGEVTLNIKNIWKEAIGILLILVWAWFGNSVYEKWNWFFIKKSIFPFLPDSIMPVMVVTCVFLVCLSVYGLYYLIALIVNKIKNKKTLAIDVQIDEVSQDKIKK